MKAREYLDRASKKFERAESMNAVVSNLLAWAEEVQREAEREATPPSDPAPVVGDGPGVTTTALPHSRACGWQKHDHGLACSRNCPTCGGSVIAPRTPPTPDAPPAPAPGEDAVEALARVLAPILVRLDIDPDNCFTGDLETARAFADDLLAAINAGDGVMVTRADVDRAAGMIECETYDGPLVRRLRAALDAQATPPSDPAPVVGDEPVVQVCDVKRPHGAHKRVVARRLHTCPGVPTPDAPPAPAPVVGDEATCGTCYRSGWIGSREGERHKHCPSCSSPCRACPDAPPAPAPLHFAGLCIDSACEVRDRPHRHDAPPAPVPGEDAVEAMGRVVSGHYATADDLCHKCGKDMSCGYAVHAGQVILAALDRGAVPGYGRTGTGDGAGEDEVTIMRATAYGILPLLPPDSVVAARLRTALGES